MGIASKLKGVKSRRKRPRPVWQGPEKDGVTYSLLNRFLQCRERFRLLVVEGLRPADRFIHRMEYGNMWHLCEEHYAAGTSWEKPLMKYCQELCKRYRTQQEQIEKWYQVCRIQFPVYASYWAKHKDVQRREPITQEEVFDVPYSLPSGRVVRLRGKQDSVDKVGKKLWLQENKTKGEIVEGQIVGQLLFDMQTMLYLVALTKRSRWGSLKLGGVRYNVVRRPLSGGRHSISQHKPTKKNPRGESAVEFYARLQGLIRDNPEFFFMRWNVTVTSGDISRFCKETLDPYLEQLCDWWGWISSKQGLKNPFDDSVHYRMPYGMYNVLTEGGSTEMDEYLATGSEVGLRYVTNLFRELA